MNERLTLQERPTVEPRWLFPVLDVVLVFVAFGLAYVFRYQLQIFRPVFDPSRSDFLPYVPYAIVYSAILLLNYQSNNLYRSLRGRAWMEEVSIIVNGVTNAAVVLLALFFLLQPEVTSRLMLVYVAGLTVVLLAAARLIQRGVLAYLRGKGIGVQRVLLLGMGETGQAVLRVLVSRSELGYKAIGYLDDDPARGAIDLGRVEGLGHLDNLEQVLKEGKVEIAIITLKWKHYDRIQDLAQICRKYNVEVRIVPDIFQLNMRQVQVENLDGIPLLGVNGYTPLAGASRFFKRALDIVLIALTSPFWLLICGLIALAIKLERDGGPIFYRQRRVGENGRKFKMIKFRTMVPNADQMRHELVKLNEQDPRRPKIVDDPRITRVGRWLRRTSLDELPNLINVLRGEMSLVGPRPPMPDEVQLYEPWHMQRLQAIPGMTGLWQVSGRSEVPFDEMCLMDIYYIENWSIKLDLQILLMTVPRVLLRSGAY